MAIGFASLVTAKHTMGVALSWGAPKIIQAADSDLGGVVGVQFVTLVPHTVALLCGLALACRHGPLLATRRGAR